MSKVFLVFAGAIALLMLFLPPSYIFLYFWLFLFLFITFNVFDVMLFAFFFGLLLDIVHVQAIGFYPAFFIIWIAALYGYSRTFSVINGYFAAMFITAAYLLYAIVAGIVHTSIFWGFYAVVTIIFSIFYHIYGCRHEYFIENKDN